MALLLLPVEQVVRELEPDGGVAHAIRFSHVLLGAVQHHVAAADLLGEEDHVAVVQHRRGDAPQTPEAPEVGGDRQGAVTQVTGDGSRGVGPAVGQLHLVVSEAPVLSRREGAVGVGHVIVIVELHDARVLHASRVEVVCSRLKDRLPGGTLKMEAVGAGGQPQADHMLGVIARGTVEHVKDSLVEIYTRVTGDQRLPLILVVGREDRVAPKFCQHHIFIIQNSCCMYTAKTYCISSAKPSTANVFVTHIRSMVI